MSSYPMPFSKWMDYDEKYWDWKMGILNKPVVRCTECSGKPCLRRFQWVAKSIAYQEFMCSECGHRFGFETGY